jgi:hypothetical protein
MLPVAPSLLPSPVRLGGRLLAFRTSVSWDGFANCLDEQGYTIPAAVMWAATPMLTALAGSLRGPLVGLRQPGLEQR